jgi:hypothetical protein
MAVARSVGVPTIKTGPTTVEEYFALIATRPDNEERELIDGGPVLNALGISLPLPEICRDTGLR